MNTARHTSFDAWYKSLMTSLIHLRGSDIITCPEQIDELKNRLGNLVGKGKFTGYQATVAEHWILEGEWPASKKLAFSDFFPEREKLEKLAERAGLVILTHIQVTALKKEAYDDGRASVLREQIPQGVAEQNRVAMQKLVELMRAVKDDDDARAEKKKVLIGLASNLGFVLMTDDQVEEIKKLAYFKGYQNAPGTASPTLDAEMKKALKELNSKIQERNKVIDDLTEKMRELYRTLRDKDIEIEQMKEAQKAEEKSEMVENSDGSA